MIIQETELSHTYIIYKTQAILRFAQFWLEWSHGGGISNQKLHSNRCSASKSMAGLSSSGLASPVSCESGAPLLLQWQQGAPAGSEHLVRSQIHDRQTQTDLGKFYIDASNMTSIKLRCQTESQYKTLITY